MKAPIDPWLQGVLAQVEELPSLPAAALEVLRLCRAEETTLDDLAGALSLDPALAARILRFANSSLFGSGEEVRTLQRAMLVLGLKTVQLMALSFSLVSAVPREGKAFDYGTYWRRSLVRAVTARSLAARVQSPWLDEAFLAGLLAEIGQVVLARCLAQEYGAVLIESARRGLAWPTAALEHELLGFDHADVGGALLRSWQLPRYIELAVTELGRAPSEPPAAPLPPEIGAIVRVLSVAAAATELLTRGGGAALTRVEELARAHFALSAEEVRSFLEALDAPLREAGEMLELGRGPGPTPEELLTAARAELLDLSLGRARASADAAAAAPDPSRLDPRTGIANHEGFARALAEEVQGRLVGRARSTLAILAVEMEDLARHGDEAARTEAERAVAGLLARLARRGDLAAHLAPGRFVLLLRDATPFGLRALAERVRAAIAGARAVPPLAASLGGACLGRVRTPADGHALLQLAQHLAQRARARGDGRPEVLRGALQAD